MVKLCWRSRRRRRGIGRRGIHCKGFQQARRAMTSSKSYLVGQKACNRCRTARVLDGCWLREGMKAEIVSATESGGAICGTHTIMHIITSCITKIDNEFTRLSLASTSLLLVVSVSIEATASQITCLHRNCCDSHSLEAVYSRETTMLLNFSSCTTLFKLWQCGVTPKHLQTSQLHFSQSMS